MALSKKAQKKIEKLVELYKAYLKLKSIGPSAITREQLRDLIRTGWIKSNEKISAPVTTSYLLTHAQTAEVSTAHAEEAAENEGMPAPGQVPSSLKVPRHASKTTQQGALNFLDRMMDRYIGKAADQLKSDILTTVEGTIMPIIDRREGQVIYDALQDKDLHKKNLRNLLKDKVDNWEYRWRTIVGTELNRASNWGAMDAILSNNPTSQPNQIMVYKQGNKPGHGACKYCEKFWYLEDGITPRVYTMEELAANGSNVGRKAKDWQPTIDSTHPNETHILRELKPGFGFVAGSLEYIGKDHSELASQRGSPVKAVK